ncbi:MAG TPA: M48 family metalloprotease, partial [Dehalococcoidia bacterium]
MTSTAIAPIPRRLDQIDSRAWEHPADRAALAALRAIPGFDDVLKKTIGAFGERGLRLAFQADAVRVSPRQFPRLHRLWLQVQETLDSPDEVPLYVSQSPSVNAGAYGVDKPWVLLLSGALRLLPDEEVGNIMGHELGHVLSGHALYHTMLEILVRLA